MAMTRKDTAAIWNAAGELTSLAYGLSDTDEREAATKAHWIGLSQHLRRITKAENKRMRQEREARDFQAQYDEGDIE